MSVGGFFSSSPDERDAAELFADGGDRVELAMLGSPRLTAPQIAFCSDSRRKVLWRGGNSIGKSFGHAWDIVHFARGTNPYRKTRRSPVDIMVAGYSYAQMDPLLDKLWKLLPKGEIDPKLYRVEGQGIKGYKEPVIRFIRGPGAGSNIFLVTYQQGAQRIKGFQGHRLSFDEPPPIQIYGEAIPRCNRYKAELRITMTPTPESPPLEYLKKEVDLEKIHEMQTSYTRAAVTVLGGLVPWAWKTNAEIEEDLLAYLADERPMREHGAWELVAAGRWLELVGEACWVDGAWPRDRRWTVAVGIDHGTRPGRQSATLVLMDDAGEVWILDEHRTETVSSVEDDAKGILAMLARNRIPWNKVDVWVGDRATPDSFYGLAKSNADLLVALAAELRMTVKGVKDRGLFIKTAWKPQNSLRPGIAKILSLARRGLLKVHAQAKGFRAAAMGWKGQLNSPLKDPVDSARYAILELLHAAVQGQQSTYTDVGL